MFKIVRLAAFCVLIQIFGSISLFAQQYSHPADPEGKLLEYSMYATDYILFSVGSSATQPIVFPEKGHVGTNGDFLMGNIPWNPGSITFYTNVYAGKTLELTTARNGAAQYIFKDTVFCPAEKPTKNIRESVHFEEFYNYESPVGSSANWADQWTKDSIKIGSSAISVKKAQHVPEGEYDTIMIVKGMTFEAGEYRIKTLLLQSDLVVNKDKNEYCRIFVRDNFEIPGENDNTKSIKSIGGDDDLGKILIYTTDEEIIANEAADPKYALNVDATIIAPASKIIFREFPVLKGQLFAKSIEFEGGFDASKGEFIPWVSANVSINTTKVKEDPNHDETNLDDSRIDRTKEYEIEVELAQGLDVEATISYAITYLGGADDPTAADFVNSYSADTLAKGKLTFAAKSTTPKTSITISPVDDNEFERNQHVLLTLYYQNGDTKEKIVLPKNGDVFEQTQLIKIEDDDPQYKAPESMSIAATLNAHENQAAGFELLAAFDVKDSDGDNNHDVSVKGEDSDKFAVTFKDGRYELRTAKKFDYEEEKHSYKITLLARDKNAISDDSLETDTITVNLLPVNDSLAVANEDKFSVSKGNSIKILFSELIDNDTDGDKEFDQTVRYISGKDDSKTVGTVKDIADGYTYDAPNTNGITVDTFYYFLSDSVKYNYSDSLTGTKNNVNADTGMIIITISESYEGEPTANNGELSVKESKGSSASLKLIDNLVNDPDLGGGDVLTLHYNSTLYGKVTPDSGTVLTSDMEITYTYDTLDAVEEFDDTFEYWITDKSNAKHNAKATITVNITALNDNEPVQDIDVVEVPYGRSTDITVLPNLWKDLDVPSLVASIDSTHPAKGIVDGPNHGKIDNITDWTTISFTPDINDVNINTSAEYQDTIIYQILDSVAYDADTAHRITDTIFIKFDEDSKDAPIANSDTIYLVEGATITTLFSLKDNDEKGKIGADLNKVVKVSDPALGEATVSEDGIVTYTHNNSENKYNSILKKFVDEFTYTVSDLGSPSKTSFPGKVVILIEPQNDNSHVEDTVTTTAVVEGGVITFDTETDLIDSSAFSLSNSGDTIHSPDVETFWLVTLKGENGGAKYASSVTINDSTNELTYTHNTVDETAEFDTVTLIVRDSTAYDQSKIHEVERTVIIPITHTNDNKPTAIDTSITITENDTATLDLREFMDDADKDVVKVSVKDKSLRATVSIDDEGTGLFQYRRNGIGDEVFEDEFTYIVEDGVDTHTVEYTVTVNILPRNDEPAKGETDDYKMNQAELLEVSVADGVRSNDSDTDSTTEVLYNNGNVLWVTLADDVNRGTLSLASDGSFTYLFDGADSVYADTFYYFVHDSAVYHLDSVHISEPIMVTIDVDPTPPTELETVVVSYFDTNSVADGLIDQIRIETEVALPEEFLNGLNDSMFTLNSARDFKIESIEQEDFGFSLFVKENSSAASNYVPNTAVSGNDLLILDNGYSMEGYLLVAKSYVINDSVAPIILNGVFTRTSKNGETSDTLAVTFSEPVVLEGIDSVRNPYNFLDQNVGTEFRMALQSNSSTESAEQANEVLDVEIAFPVTGDSIKIEFDNMVRDAKFNYSSNTVWAPLIVPNPYAFELELYIYPQPLEFTESSSEGVVALELDANLCATYGIPQQNGVAIVLESKGPLMWSDENVAKLQIFDNTGNSVTAVEHMEFVRKTNDNSIAGIFVWDGTNLNGRSSGRSAYLIGVDVSVKTDEGENSRTIQKQFIKTIGVKQ